MTLCNACGLRNAKRRCSGAVRQKPPQTQTLPQTQTHTHTQPQPQPQQPAYPQLAVPMQSPPMARPNQPLPQPPPMPPHNPAQLQASLPPQPYGHFFYNAGYPTPYPGMILPPKAPPQPFSPPGPMAQGHALMPDAMPPPQHVSLAA